MRKLFLFIASLVFTGCTNSTSGIIGNLFSGDAKEIKGSDRYVTKDFRVKPFTALECQGVMNVVFVQSADSSAVSVKAPDNYVELIEIYAKDSTLHIQCPKDLVLTRGSVEVCVQSPRLNAVATAGAGNFTLDKGLRTDALDFTLAGAGDVSLKRIDSQGRLKLSLAGAAEVDCEGVRAHDLYLEVAGTGDLEIEDALVGDTYIVMAGAGDVTLKGKSRTASFDIAGAGDISAADFECQDVSVQIAGVGSVECFAVKTLNVQKMALGSVSYKGNPRIVGKSKSLSRIDD